MVASTFEILMAWSVFECVGGVGIPIYHSFIERGRFNLGNPWFTMGPPERLKQCNGYISAEFHVLLIRRPLTRCILRGHSEVRVPFWRRRRSLVLSTESWHGRFQVLLVAPEIHLSFIVHGSKLGTIIALSNLRSPGGRTRNPRSTSASTSDDSILAQLFVESLVEQAEDISTQPTVNALNVDQTLTMKNVAMKLERACHEGSAQPCVNVAWMVEHAS